MVRRSVRQCLRSPCPTSIIGRHCNREWLKTLRAMGCHATALRGHITVVAPVESVGHLVTIEIIGMGPNNDQKTVLAEDLGLYCGAGLLAGGSKTSPGAHAKPPRPSSISTSTSYRLNSSGYVCSRTPLFCSVVVPSPQTTRYEIGSSSASNAAMARVT